MPDMVELALLGKWVQLECQTLGQSRAWCHSFRLRHSHRGYRKNYGGENCSVLTALHIFSHGAADAKATADWVWNAKCHPIESLWPDALDRYAISAVNCLEAPATIIVRIDILVTAMTAGKSYEWYLNVQVTVIHLNRVKR